MCYAISRTAGSRSRIRILPAPRIIATLFAKRIGPFSSCSTSEVDLGRVWLIISLTKDRVLSGHFPGSENLGFHIVMLLLSLSSIFISSRRYQEASGIAGAGIIAVYIAMLFPRLQ